MKRDVNTSAFGTLRDFTPMCARCKTMRNAEGYWVQVGGASRSACEEVEFAYCICAKCARKLYPDKYGKTR